MRSQRPPRQGAEHSELHGRAEMHSQAHRRPVAATKGAEELYDLQLTLLHEVTHLPHATRGQAIAALERHADNIASWISGAEEMHRSLARLRADSPVVSAASEGMAAVGEQAHEFWAWTKSVLRGKHGEHESPQYLDSEVRLPGTEVWDLPLDLLHAARRALHAGETEEASAQDPV